MSLAERIMNEAISRKYPRCQKDNHEILQFFCADEGCHLNNHLEPLCMKCVLECAHLTDGHIIQPINYIIYNLASQTESITDWPSIDTKIMEGIESKLKSIQDLKRDLDFLENYLQEVKELCRTMYGETTKTEKVLNFLEQLINDDEYENFIEHKNQLLSVVQLKNRKAIIKPPELSLKTSKELELNQMLKYLDIFFQQIATFNLQEIGNQENIKQQLKDYELSKIKQQIKPITTNTTANSQLRNFFPNNDSIIDQQKVIQDQQKKFQLQMEREQQQQLLQLQQLKDKYEPTQQVNQLTETGQDSNTTQQKVINNETILGESIASNDESEDNSDFDLKNFKGQQIQMINEKTTVCSVLPLTSTIFAYGSNNTIIIYDLVKGRNVREFSEHTSYVWRMCKINDKNIASLGNDGQIVIWNWKLGNQLRKIQGVNFFIKSNICKISDSLLVCGDRNHYLKVFNWQDGKIAFEIRNAHMSGIRDLLMIDSRRLASASEDSYVKVWSVRDWSLVQEIKLDQMQYGLVNINEELFGCASSNGSIKIINKIDFQITSEIDCNSYDNCYKVLLINEDSLAVPGNKVIKIWNWKKKECITELKCKSNYIFDLNKIDNETIICSCSPYVLLWK